VRARHRWNEPCIPTDNWLDPDHVQITRDGRVMQITCFQFSNRNMRRIRQGHVCAKCWNPQETPFPEHCAIGWCRFPMRTEQAAYLARMYRDNVMDGGDAAAEEDQRARISEAREKWALEAAGLTRKGSILVPRGIDSGT
jgi:hypothetical protein